MQIQSMGNTNEQQQLKVWFAKILLGRINPTPRIFFGPISAQKPDAAKQIKKAAWETANKPKTGSVKTRSVTDLLTAPAPLLPPDSCLLPPDS